MKHADVKGFGIAAAFGWLLLTSCGAPDSGLTASGTLEAVQIRIPSRSAGTVTEVLVSEGMTVSAGDVLAVQDDRALVLQRDQARAARDMAAAALDLLSQGARKEDLEQAREALSSARENRRLVTEEADRLRALMASGSVSRQQLDRAESAEVLAEGAEAQAASALAKLESGAREPELAGARAALDQARATLSLAERALSDSVVRAPSGGTVLYRMLESGEWAAPGMTVFVIADISRLRLTVYVPEPELVGVYLGQKARIRMDGSDEVVAGTVSWISPEAEFTPKNVQIRDERVKQVFALRIDVENSAGLLKPGMPADATLLAAGDTQK
jgi:HlyD family secretion protein